MSAPRKQPQVSLRGASAKEVTRDALLEQVAHERELRSFNRAAAAAALLIQRIWRRYYAIKNLAMKLKKEWEALVNQRTVDMTCRWISNNLLRPFLFFVTRSSTLNSSLLINNVKCTSTCFTILLQSINSTGKGYNFCYLTMGTDEEKSTWFYQARKLIMLCSSILAKYDSTCSESEGITDVTALAMRLVVSLTDSKGWKCCVGGDIVGANTASKRLIGFMIRRDSGMYSCIRRYLMKLGSHAPSRKNSTSSTDFNFLITASALTLALRPFHFTKFDGKDNVIDVKYASKQYCISILTVPYLAQSLPSILLPALRHESTLLPSLDVLLVRLWQISENAIFDEILKLEQSENSSTVAAIPSSGWALANIVNLATECNCDSGNSGPFVQGLDCGMYLHAANCISENFVTRLEKSGKSMKKGNDEYRGKEATSLQEINSDSCDGKIKLTFIELLEPVHQQWHLRELLTMTKKNVYREEADIHATSENRKQDGHIKLLDVVYFYCYMLRIFSSLNPVTGPLPILNLLSFTPGFLLELWENLEGSIFHGSEIMSNVAKPCRNSSLGNFDEAIIDKKQKSLGKESGNKWMNVLHKIAGKSTELSHTNSSRDPISFNHVDEDAHDLWDIGAVRTGPQGISKDLLCMLHLFSATYAHLLLVLDDIEFYDKQVPFTLQQQQRIASVLNTFVYNSFIQNGGLNNKHITDAAVRCLHLLYERDCRHTFCSPSLWLGPAQKGRIPIVAAARAHEAAFTNLHAGVNVSIPSTSSILTTIPHVYPFEERVQMFREFIKLDRVAGRVTGEVSGPYSGSIDIVVRRDKIVEDGYRQLNFLGPRLKSCINVSFVSECGLPEAGLDYGGLSKEFLTDLSKAAFGPQYGLFIQSSTSECNLIPNMSARLLDNGMEMFQFLGRIVGKALYEGILLDYSLSLVFVQKLLGRYSFLDDLSALDSELYRNLIYVKHYDGDVAELSLDFTVTEEIGGKCTVFELRPDGKNMCVTNDNKLQYIHAMADYKLNRQILPFANAFYWGLVDLISPSWLRLFNANEFNQLLSGGKHDFDADDLRINTRYTGGYSERSRTVKLFWEVVGGFRPSERCMLLKFVTSCSRPPLLGFAHLQPSFTIHKVACDVPLWASVGGQDVDRLPSASTCYNTLKLPTYKRSSTLRNKLLYAISSNTGFELS